MSTPEITLDAETVAAIGAALRELEQQHPGYMFSIYSSPRMEAHVVHMKSKELDSASAYTPDQALKNLLYYKERKRAERIAELRKLEAEEAKNANG